MTGTVVGVVLGGCGVVFGLGAVARRMRVELPDDANSRWDALRAALRRTWWVWLLITVMFVGIGWGGTVGAASAGAALTGAMLLAARATVSLEGVDREVLLGATSAAFFVTILGSGVYALFEVLAGAPRLSMWVVWSVGMATWAVATAVRARRFN